MAVRDQVVTNNYALYNGDCMEVMKQIPDDAIHFSIYSPPFFASGGTGGMYHYSSDERDLSNNPDYTDFLKHYEFIIKEIHRITMPGRITAVHCTDLPKGNTGKGDGLHDFPGDIIRLHEANGWEYAHRYHVWKEPLGVRNRTMKKGLAHQTIVNDATKCDVASADYVVTFRSLKGDNPVPVAHPRGLSTYAGSREIPEDLFVYQGWEGKQIENRLSHWIWRQYASAFWDDVRIGRVLPYKQSRDQEDERHVHPLQLDVIDRLIVLFSNPGERVWTPFMGVGSEVYGAVRAGRFGIGAELKPSYYRQSVKNVEDAAENQYSDMPLFSMAGVDTDA